MKKDDKQENRNESNGASWYPYVAGVAATVLAGPYAGAGIFGASKAYENLSTEPKSQNPKP